MSSTIKPDDRGRKLPVVGESLFQIGNDLRPRIDSTIMRHSPLPDQAVMDARIFPWISMLETNWGRIRDEAVKIRAQEIPALGDISPDHGRAAADLR